MSRIDKDKIRFFFFFLGETSETKMILKRNTKHKSNPEWSIFLWHHTLQLFGSVCLSSLAFVSVWRQNAVSFSGALMGCAVKICLSNATHTNTRTIIKTSHLLLFSATGFCLSHLDYSLSVMLIQITANKQSQFDKYIAQVFIAPGE